MCVMKSSQGPHLFSSELDQDIREPQKQQIENENSQTKDTAIVEGRRGKPPTFSKISRWHQKMPLVAGVPGKMAEAS